MNRASLQGEYAGFMSRAGAFITDIVIISLVLLVVNWFVPVMFSQFFRTDLFTCAAGTERVIRPYTCTIVLVGLYVFTITFPILYTIFFWVTAGQTPGKYLFGVKVVRLNGHRMSLGVSLLRYVGYILGILSLGLGFLNVLISNRRQGWHDLIAHTCVIYAWEARQDEAFLDRVRQRLDHSRSNNT